MKQIIIITIFMAFINSSFAQESTFSQPLTQHEYLAKSKTQKIVAFVLLAGGISMFAIAAPGNVSFGTLGALVVVGAAATLGSIPLFIASAHNKRRAAHASASIQFPKAPPSGYPTAFHTYPALSIKIHF